MRLELHDLDCRIVDLLYNLFNKSTTSRRNEVSALSVALCINTAFWCYHIVYNTPVVQVKQLVLCVCLGDNVFWTNWHFALFFVDRPLVCRITLILYEVKIRGQSLSQNEKKNFFGTHYEVMHTFWYDRRQHQTQLSHNLLVTCFELKWLVRPQARAS